MYSNHVIISNGPVCAPNCNLNQRPYCKHGHVCTERNFGNALGGRTDARCGQFYVGPTVDGTGIFGCDWDGKMQLCGPF